MAKLDQYREYIQNLLTKYGSYQPSFERTIFIQAIAARDGRNHRSKAIALAIKQQYYFVTNLVVRGYLLFSTRCCAIAFRFCKGECVYT